MPSNQYPRQLTRPKRVNGLTLERADPFVQTFHRFITTFSWIAVSVIFLCSLSDDLLGDSQTLGGKAISAVPDRLVGWGGFNKGKPLKKPECSPFALPGFVASAQGSLATWQPLSDSCPRSQFLPSVRAVLNRPSSTADTSSSPALLTDGQLQPILANRSVLILGDIVDINLLSHFCELVQGSSLVKVDKNHPWGDALNRVPDKHVWPETAPLKQSGISKPKEASDAALAHYCYVSHYDLLLSVVPTYGSDYLDTFHETKAYHSPGLFEHRVSDLVVPYLQETVKSAASFNTHDLPPPRKTSTPDLTIVSSSFYDLALFALQDIGNHGSLTSDLTEARIREWRGRYVEMLAATNRVLGIHSGKKGGRGLTWRNLHFPNEGIDGAAATVEWFLGSQEGLNHPLFHANRIAQLNAAWKSAVAPPEGTRAEGETIKGSRDRTAQLPSDVRGMDLATVLLGQDHHQKDRLVPDLSPAGALFSEMLFFELWNAVTSG
ncbi:hypothetical protein OC846_003266 [Tilletia horrida]|uniref:Uncharacterized protein n=1 Tax=Tilletia horrida TaxID=155126 RepID=A0AAN6GQQ6_9BASI|nr:hypothetical protein OC845_004190 [Tilletia horrida]KAK0551488.1 hypothetical protein OC846_003266 [Tilletia horrida]KAK0566514.1 hypothetical protein OC861_003204 [Tilletia horrida]